MSKEHFDCIVFGKKLTFRVDPKEQAPLKEILSQLEKAFAPVIDNKVVLTNDFIKKLIELFAHYTHYKNQYLKEVHLSEESLQGLTDLVKNISQLLDG